MVLRRARDWGAVILLECYKLMTSGMMAGPKLDHNSSPVSFNDEFGFRR